MAFRIYTCLGAAMALLSVGPGGWAGPISLAEPVDKSLKPDILYYPFDEITGNHVLDGSGNEGGGELRAGSFSLPELRAGVNERFGQALHFEGGSKLDPGTIRNPFIMGKSHDKLDLVGRSFTMGVWLRFDDDSCRKVEILSRGASSTISPEDAGYTWALDRKDGDVWQLSLQIRDGLGANPTRGTGYVLTMAPGVWYHLGMVFNQEDRTATFFFNGSPQATVAIPADIGKGDDIFVIGERRTSTYVSDFRGSLDDLFITEGGHEFVPSGDASASPLSP